MTSRTPIMLKSIPRFSRNIVLPWKVQYLRDFSRTLSQQPQHIGYLSPHRHFSKIKDSAVTEVYFEEIFEQGFEGDDPLFDLRNYLYPDSEDPHIHNLSAANSIAEVLSSCEDLDLKPEHLTQALATLHHLQKLCQIRNTQVTSEVRESAQNFNVYLEQQEKFQQLLKQLEEKIHLFNYRENAFSLMVLRKLGIPLSDRIMQKLYVRLIDFVDELDLEALSYLTVALRPRLLQSDDANASSWMFGLLPIIPRLSQLLEECSTPLELKRIAICFCTMSLLISDRMMVRLCEKFRSMVDEGWYEDVENVRTLKKLLSLVLNKADWHSENQDHVKLLLHQHLGKVANLRPIHVTLLSKVMKTYCQPAQLDEEVYERLCELFARDKETAEIGGISNISVLSLILENKNLAIPIKEVETRLRRFLKSDQFLGNLGAFYSIIKSVGLIDKRIIDDFFSISLDYVEKERIEVRNLGIKLNILGGLHNGFYKNKDIEQKISRILESNILDSYKPGDFAEHLSLIMSLGGNVSEEMKDKFVSCLPQFNAYHLMSLSRGIRDKMWEQNRGRQGIKHRAHQDTNYHLVDEISVAVSKASFNLLTDERRKLSLLELSFLLRNLTERSASCDESYYFVIKKRLLEEMPKMQMLHSQHISKSLRIMSPFMEFPELTDCLLQFYQGVSDIQDVHVRGFLRFMNFCYKSNHRPGNDFLDIFAKALFRDMEKVPGLCVVEAGILLAAFNHFPEFLAQDIFSSSFMSKLDLELKQATGNRNYTHQLRYKLMVLNRCLVLQFPEYGVPWFHEAYCKENLQFLRSTTNSQLGAEVYEELCNALGGWRYVKSKSVSRYYNPVHYEIGLDESGSPVDLYTDGVVPDRRIAVQVYADIGYTQDTKRLQGDLVQNNLHLSLQGWQVLTINPFSWKSMYLSDSQARKQYLQETVQAMSA